MTMTAAIVLPLTLALDGALGDPPNRFHPVAWLGSVVNRLMLAAPKDGARRQLAFGTALALGLFALSIGLGVALELALAALPLPVRIVLTVLVLDMTLALRGLGLAARYVTDALASEDIAGARERLGALCSREASDLREPELVSGAVASLAENANDSVVAPIFYYALFGLPGALAFRTLNTLDAMLGYRDHREYLGKASAHLDDVAGYVPARITALMLVAAGFLLGADARGAVHTWRRDARHTPSPNGGHPMATMAGLLGIRIEKPGVYTLGDGRLPERADVPRALRIVIVACVLFTLLTSALLYGLHG